ncbi:MAG: DUF2970 domain-containing protein [Halomonas sp.]|nr:DUF2970 domain-containing protein [Halomonas sp.]
MWEVIKSVLAAFFGVQKEQQRQRDFTRETPVAFVVTGVVLALVLVAGILVVAMLAAG